MLPKGPYQPSFQARVGGTHGHLNSARQKTHFFREPVLPRLVISGLIINTGAIFSCRRIKNDNNFYLWRLQVIPAP
ncbi:MAG: hypothetical protein KZQ62_00400, partial [Candidatus Thiodiazotropha sp. (ex Lucinoma aequizonata)]|nr:hypothetical protein [Candidatus Thiodiazotropha sp. (ex Lucinoma aequizonata)]